MGRSKGGRPRSGAESQGTTQTRVFTDIGEMIYWIGEITDIPSANLLDPIIRPELEAIYEKHRPEIDKLKSIRHEFQQATAEVKQEVALQGGKRKRKE